jgi:hypothetical protein
MRFGGLPDRRVHGEHRPRVAFFPSDGENVAFLPYGWEDVAFLPHNGEEFAFLPGGGENIAFFRGGGEDRAEPLLRVRDPDSYGG